MAKTKNQKSSLSTQKVLSSYKDPSGFIFKKGNLFYRQVNFSYKKNFDLLVSSGLLDELWQKKYLISHQEVLKNESLGYKILKPAQIPFVSYPYEWCFDQLKDAALLTLKIQNIALSFNQSLKDASAYNIQFIEGRPILCDTLSFEKYHEGRPWIAYRQFCQHFLAPLALMAFADLRLNLLNQLYLDGLPLDLTAKLLPLRARFSLGLGTHLFLHAKSQQKTEETFKPETKKLSKNQLLGIIDSLSSTVRNLKPSSKPTVWGNYYQKTNYSVEAQNNKKDIIAKWISKLKPMTLWDAGANDGHFSRLGSKQKIFTLATDFDPLAIENAYLRAKNDQDKFLLPLIIDLTNPSPSLGWQNQERPSFIERSKFDLTLCLAFVHHLAIANNLPLHYIAELFSRQTRFLIIEFVPKEDSNAKRLLSSREDIFSDYNQTSFEKNFQLFFQIKARSPIKGSLRTLYLMEKRVNV